MQHADLSGNTRRACAECRIGACARYPKFGERSVLVSI